MNDSVIIGCGPAGISAGLYLKRAGLDPIIVAKGSGSLSKAKSIENYYGFEAISGKELELRGVRQAQAMGIGFVRDEVVDISFADAGYTVSTTNERYETKSLILACGMGHNKPSLPGFDELLGSGTSYCAVCDGFFFRGKIAGVIGNGSFAFSEASYLSSLCEKVIIFGDGEYPSLPGNVIQEKRKLLSLEKAESVLSGVKLSDGEFIRLNGLFSAIGTAGAFSFAKKLGLKLNGTSLAVNERMSCGAPGIFAAGDCTGAPRQIAKAVYDGMIAANSVIEYLNKEI